MGYSMVMFCCYLCNGMLCVLCSSAELYWRIRHCKSASDNDMIMKIMEQMFSMQMGPVKKTKEVTTVTV